MKHRMLFLAVVAIVIPGAAWPCNLNEIENIQFLNNQWEVADVEDVSYQPVRLKHGHEKYLLHSDLGPVLLVNHSTGSSFDPGESIGHFNKMSSVLSGFSMLNNYDKIAGIEDMSDSQLFSRLRALLFIPCGELSGYKVTDRGLPDLRDLSPADIEKKLKQFSEVYSQLDQSYKTKAVLQSDGTLLKHVRGETLNNYKEMICKLNELDQEECKLVNFTALMPNSQQTGSEWLSSYAILLAPSELKPSSIVYAWIVGANYNENKKLPGLRQFQVTQYRGESLSGIILKSVESKEAKVALKNSPAFKLVLKKDKVFSKKNKGKNIGYPYLASEEPAAKARFEFVSEVSGKNSGGMSEVVFSSNINDLKNNESLRDKYRYYTDDQVRDLMLRIASKRKNCHRYDTGDQECAMNKVNGFEQPSYCKRYARCEADNEYRMLKGLLPHVKKDSLKKKGL